MTNFFNDLIVSAPNHKGGLLLIRHGKVYRLGNLGICGISYRESQLCIAIQPDSLLIVSAAEFRSIDEIVKDVHDVYFDDSGLYSVSTSKNSIFFYEPQARLEEIFCYSDEPDSAHVNCLSKWDGKLIYSAFGRFKKTRDYKGNTLNKGYVALAKEDQIIIGNLSQPHSITEFNGGLILANSELHEVHQYNSKLELCRVKKLSGYTRGISLRGDFLYVGISKSRNTISNVSTAKLICLDVNTFDILASIDLPCDEVYSVHAINDAEALSLLSLLPMAASAFLEKEKLLIESQLIQINQNWTDRLRGSHEDFQNELLRVAEERDQLLFEKDVAWERRLNSSHIEFETELARIALERDHLLVAKDEFWSERLMLTAQDFEAEIKRIADERDDLLAEKDRSWGERLMLTARDFETEIKRIADERDELLVEKDKIWGDTLDAKVAEIQSKSMMEIERMAKTHSLNVEQKEIGWLKKMKSISPKVSIIIVNYNGKSFLDELFASIKKQTLQPDEVIIVDNASSDDSCQYIRTNYPWVTLVESESNRGFAGGNNLGVSHAKFPLVVLLNNDTLVSEDWLELLVSAWIHNTSNGIKVGAISPKIRFKERFLRVRFLSKTFIPSENDTRALGVAVDLNEMKFGGCNYLKPIIQRGFYDEERWDGRLMRWTSGDASVFVPVSSVEELNDLNLNIYSQHDGVELNLFVEDQLVGTYLLVQGFNKVNCLINSGLREQSFWVINNAGSRLDSMGNAADIGINEPDIGQYNSSSVLEAFCGCSCLIPKKCYTELGGFDERLFMYYEDADLSWRMRDAGYSILYEPNSIVRHVHAGSSVEWSPAFRYHVIRNHKLIALKNVSLIYLPVAFSKLVIKVFSNIYKFGFVVYLESTRSQLSKLSPDQIECKALHDALKMSASIILSRIRPYKKEII